ncbi:hypothetical protein [Crateriforma conspicua]|uniref:Uncharacterized protein n=1 Tax=Crateriforma conspicua TaxID=2527996 RepID=A0A5C6FVW8_9PLAN|nr:hypothetical protein [Crateriforma conspicua]QDV63614.1 hypothetical protein Mal65_27590 [Crateriforma conspicua]TWT68892.1 hypothetical protein Pan14r_11750 [Crateriforma conspicua]TWU67069.1 hypothetical protein V7x_26410 [Crateriforma conspicua]
MIGFSPSKIDLDRLRMLVEHRLCELGHLETQQFPLTMREVIRGGNRCGFYFCLHGPRSVKLTAICDLKRKSILYYGPDGIRKDTVELPLLSDSMLEKAG